MLNANTLAMPNMAGAVNMCPSTASDRCGDVLPLLLKPPVGAELGPSARPETLILGESLSGPRVAERRRATFPPPGCRNSIIRRLSVSERACSGRRAAGAAAARSQHATRGLRTPERPPLSRVRTAHVAGCTAPPLSFTPLYNSTAESPKV